MPMRGRSFFDSCVCAVDAVKVYAAQMAAEAFAESFRNFRLFMVGKLVGGNLELYNIV